MVKQRVPYFPVMATFDMSGVCNLDCYMCPRQTMYNPATRKKLPTLKFSTFEKIMANCPTLGKINLVGAGEPLMHPEIEKFYEYADQNGLFVMTTINGTLIHKYIDKFPKMMQIHISIESTNPETYTSTKGGAKIEELYRNLSILKTQRPDIDLILQSLLMKENMYDLKGVVDLCAKYNATFTPIYPIMPTMDYYTKMSVYEDVNLPWWLYQLGMYCAIKGVKNYIPPSMPVLKDCGVNHAIFVDGNGIQMACCYACHNRFLGEWEETFLGEKHILPQPSYIMGDLSKESIFDYWYGENYTDIRKWQNAQLPKVMDINLLKRMRTEQAKIQKEQPHSYCTVCLYRWQLGC